MLTSRSRHHGMAYLLVMLAVSVAAVLGLAILSSATLQAEVSATNVRATAAEYVAESALHAGTYYLQNPSAAPASWTGRPGHTLYASNINLGGLPGTFDIDVTPGTTRNLYNLSVTGRDASVQPIARSATAAALVIRAKPTFAGVFGSGLAVSNRCTFNGPALAGALPTFVGSGTINGSVRTALTPLDFVIPTAATINLYGAATPAAPYTLPDGSTIGVADDVSASITAAPAASAANRGAVFYHVGDVTINAATAITIPGTLVVKGNLTIKGASVLTITPQTCMPALVTTGIIHMSGKNCTAQLNGVVWTGGGVDWIAAPNSSTNLRISGSLLMPSGATLGTNATGAISVTYNASLVDVPDIATTPQPVASIKMQAWKQ